MPVGGESLANGKLDRPEKAMDLARDALAVLRVLSVLEVLGVWRVLGV